MRKFINFIQKYWLFIALAFIATLLLILWVLRGNQPSKESLPQLPTLVPPVIYGQSVPSNLRFVASIPSLPQKIQLTKRPLISFPESKAKIIADFFRFSGKPIISGGSNLIWNEEERFLQISQTEGKITFGRFNQSLEQGNLVESKVAEDLLRDLVKSLGIVSPNTQLVGDKPKYLKIIASTLIVGSPQNSDLIEVFLTPQISNIRVVGSIGEPLISGRFAKTKNGALFSLTAQVFSNPTTDQIFYPLKNEQELQQTISSEGVTVLGVLDSESEIDTQEISYLTINTVEFVLLYQEKTDYLFPMFLLKGDATTLRSEVVPASILLPAIKSQYLTPATPTPTPGF